MKQNKKLNIAFHVRYPYTAIIIATIWIGIVLIILNQKNENCELLIGAASLCTLIIAIIGFKSPN